MRLLYRSIWTIIFFAGMYGTACAGVEDAISSPKIQHPLPDISGDFDMLTIPLKRVQNLFLIEARIDSMEGNFILDTGAPYLVLNKTYFRNGRLQDGVFAYGVSGGGNKVMQTTVDSLQIGALTFTGVSADIVNLGHIEDARGVKILGLLGASLFSELELVIDARQSVLYIYKLDKEGNRIWNGDTLPGPKLSLNLEQVHDILFLEAESGKKKLRFCFDTGAEVNLLSNSVSNKVLEHFVLNGTGALTGTGSNTVGTLRGTLSTLEIQDHTFRDMPFLLTNLSNLQLAYDVLFDGVLGYSLLSEGIVVLNIKKKKLDVYFYTDNE
ncbi:MAG: aspartyl protease family protein [Chitinophagales bacterium]